MKKRKRYLQPPFPALREFSKTLPVAEGGTEATTEPDAIVNLGGIAISSINQANGVAGLDANALLPVSLFPEAAARNVTLTGPLTLATNQQGSYVINNYHAFKTYTVSTATGTISIAGDTITYTAPAVAGPAGFTINGQEYVITVFDPYVATPDILAPVDGATNTATSITATATAFAVIGGSDTHESSDWQLATDSGFTAIVQQTTADAVNKTSWPVADLTADTTYYIRVRYKGTSLGYSQWSAVSSFTTNAASTVSSEITILTAFDKAVDDKFGATVAMSNDGLRIVVGAPNNYPTGGTRAGGAYVYLWNGTTWAFEAKLTGSDAVVDDGFGLRVAIDNTGDRIAVSAPYQDNFVLTDVGAVYIFIRSGTSWTEEAKLLPSIHNGDDNFGSWVDFDANADRLAIGAFNQKADGVNNTGAAYVFTRTGTAWAEEDILIASDAAPGDGFARQLSITADGSRIIVGAQDKTVTSVSTAGSVYIFSRALTTWTEEVILTETVPSVFASLGVSVSIDATGARVAVGAYYGTNGATPNTGLVYIYSRSGTTWTEEEILMLPDAATADVFGAALALNDAGDVVLITATNRSPGAVSAAGAAYVFSRTGTTWAVGVELSASNKQTNDNFGDAVSINSSGSRAVITAKQSDPSGVSNAGTAYVYH